MSFEVFETIFQFVLIVSEPMRKPASTDTVLVNLFVILKKYNFFGGRGGGDSCF